MGLRHLRLPEATIKLSDGQDFTVRGISLPDIKELANAHGPTMAMLYDRFITQREGDDTSMALIGKTLLDVAPELAVSVIAYGADAAGDEDFVRRLPFPVQLEALEQIARLTFTTEESLGKVVEIVTRAAQAGMKALQQVQMPLNPELLKGGSEGSAQALAS